MKRKIAFLISLFGVALALAAGCVYGVGLLDVARATSEPIQDTDSRAEAATSRPSHPEQATAAGAAPNSSTPQATDVPIYGWDTDPASITYPADMPSTERADAQIWVEQQFIIAKCMYDQGFEYTWTLPWERPAWMLTSPVTPLTEEGGLALNGNTGAGPNYRWQDAGCHGYAVHVTGQDGAH